METSEKFYNVTIIGGGGYIGYHIGVALSDRGHKVTLFDITQPDSFWLDITNMTEVTSHVGDTSSWSDGHIMYKKIGQKTNSLQFIRGSLLNADVLDSVVKGADCVIHCASYGMSGKEQMPDKWCLTEQVNITGTENVIKSCQREGVRGLVYTSTFNVVYGGQEIINGDESLPYFSLHHHEDHYSRTKAIAERLVIFNDHLTYGKSTGKSEENPPLRTCALRLAGVMGLGEKRHLPRIVDWLGFLFFHYSYGENSLQQFATIGNVVQAHVKATEHILAHPDRLGGQAYFISDVTPINSFEFLRPLREALGYSPPKFKMPMWVMWLITYLIQAIHSLLTFIHPRFAFAPMLTPAELYKTARTHYFSSDKAKQDFGYAPQNPNDISAAIKYFCDKKKKYEDQERDPMTVFISVVVIGSRWIRLSILAAILLYFYFA